MVSEKERLPIGLSWEGTSLARHSQAELGTNIKTPARLNYKGRLLRGAYPKANNNHCMDRHTKGRESRMGAGFMS